MILCPATKGVAEVFSVDLTFKLGGFYKTVTSFRNPMLINKERTQRILVPYKFNTGSWFRHTNFFRALSKELNLQL